ncbi:class I tRNA ligase family protein, partial [Candidatus Saccharibacteria bacterium]|nr:class I tRNA ligase family protein [Candidatus Saccharibacteria bacterium]
MKNEPKNKFYVTTSIPYVNDKPHIGHLLEFVQADTLARYHRGKGEDTFLLTGTDEHGQKIFEAAAKLGEDTKEFAGKNSDEFRKLAEAIGMSNDYFVRTTDDRHKLAAQKLWQACEKDIYKGEYEGLYCVGCERYYTESEAEDECCPIHKTKLSKLKMESYFFAQSKYKDKLLTLINTGEFRILPEKRKNEMLTFIENLTDVSISRPKIQLEWGVEVPGDSEHVMYVWFDALSNYISAIGYADDSKMFEKFWPADVHVVGKDIARFHTILW